MRWRACWPSRRGSMMSRRTISTFSSEARRTPSSPSMAFKVVWPWAARPRSRNRTMAGSSSTINTSISPASIMQRRRGPQEDAGEFPESWDCFGLDQGRSRRAVAGDHDGRRRPAGRDHNRGAHRFLADAQYRAGLRRRPGVRGARGRGRRHPRGHPGRPPLPPEPVLQQPEHRPHNAGWHGRLRGRPDEAVRGDRRARWRRSLRPVRPTAGRFPALGGRILRHLPAPHPTGHAHRPGGRRPAPRPPPPAAGRGADESYATFRPFTQQETITDKEAFDAASDRGLRQIEEMELEAEKLDGLGESLTDGALQRVDRAAQTSESVLLGAIFGLLVAGAAL